ncbi:hypothetical protein ACLKMY_35220 [Paraburkholderia mimosarum]|uniref:hypothetical protein n=1 Tax=Paraburkholderia mimosarum TaxID=312026 RepID=UPI00056D72C9|nr:hypothetical protein [Paraburkholderia mimosarum]
MADYSITAANHKNPSNHVASSFLVWVQDPKEKSWSKLGGKSASQVVELIESGNTVRTGKLSADGKLATGEPIEVELRIAKNKTNYDVTKMPTF